MGDCFGLRRIHRPSYQAQASLVGISSAGEKRRPVDEAILMLRNKEASYFLATTPMAGIFARNAVSCCERAAWR